MARIFMVTLGCAKNRVDAENILGFAARDGHEIVADPGDADVLVVNTCAFIETAREESVDTVIEASRIKETRPGTRLVVTGCLPQRYGDDLAAALPEVDLFAGTGRLEALAETLRSDSWPEGRLAVGDPHPRLDMPRLRTTAPHSAYVKVSDGCSRACSFCAIPGIRGPQRSLAPELIEAEVRDLVAGGTVEVNLVAQDLTAYGDDNGTSLAALVRRLARTEGLRWLRLLYGYPTRFTDELIEVIADEPVVCNYVDVPFQHIDDDVLHGMRRGTKGDDIRRLVDNLRHAVPDVVIRTALLVGFPGESDEAFSRLRDFVEDTRLDRLGVFAFSREEGTASFDLPSRVPPELAEARRDELMELQRKISREKNEEMLGRKVPVLVEGLSEESDLLLQGRTAGQAPEVDGVTYLNDGTAQPGEIRQVEITQVGDYDLVGGIVD